MKKEKITNVEYKEGVKNMNSHLLFDSNGKQSEELVSIMEKEKKQLEEKYKNIIEKKGENATYVRLKREFSDGYVPVGEKHLTYYEFIESLKAEIAEDSQKKS